LYQCNGIIDQWFSIFLLQYVLNTKAVLHQRLSSYKSLAKADKKTLMQYELISNGIGIHWKSLDEDLSLKGFLRDELRNVVKKNKDTLAA